MNKIVNQKITYSIGLRSDVNKNQEYGSIYIVLHLDNKRAGKKNLNIKVKKEKWNKEAQEIRNPKLNEIKDNQIIRNIKNLADEVKSTYMLNNKILTWDLFIAEIFDFGAAQDFFHHWEIVANRKTQTTRKSYIKNMNYIKKFAPTASFAQVNSPKFCNDLRYFLKNQYVSDKVNGLNDSTINKTIDQLKSVLMDAKNNKIIHEINLNSIKRLPLPDVEKIFLKCDELKELINYYYSYRLPSIKAENSLKAFLFCCFTGIRLGDVMNLKYGNIRNGCWDNLSEGKTTYKRRDKIYDMAFKFIDKPTKENQNEFVFNMLCEQKTRKLIKQVIEDFNMVHQMQLNTHISFHSSKKTCINLVMHFSQNSDYAKFKGGHKLGGITNQYYLEIANTQIEVDTNAKINAYFEE